MNSDKKIWETSLRNEENVDMFKTEPGGPNAKPLPKKEIFKTPKEKKLEERIKQLEEQVNLIIKELRKMKRTARRTKSEKTIVYVNDEQTGLNKINENKN